MKKIILSIVFYGITSILFSQIKIGMFVPDTMQRNPCVKAAIDDAQKLFIQARGCSFSFDTSNTDLALCLPKEFYSGGGFGDYYFWSMNKRKWYLYGSCPKAVANGIYGLLQEVLGFKFYHPREIFIPDYSTFQIPEYENFSGEPSFGNIGFHLHTMHPIELTEDLLDEKRDGGFERICEYIDWLARNGQNYWEFNVLESIELEAWIHHAKKISDYSHSRGIKCGLDLSLHMLQQKAFQLYETPPFKFASITKQLEYKVSMLEQTNFDVWNVELSSTEFTSGDQEKKKGILNYLQHLIPKNLQLMSRNHVVKPDQMINDGNGEGAGDILAEGQGLMVHTVMFYSLTDEKAPVYRNKNLRHMYDILQHEKTRRPVWYFPESAYWVTFDSSVPMFLLPYFSARLSDIELCERENVQGHLTFSSGWEWGYGYIDWSIARWCWKYQINRKEVKRSSLQYLSELVSPDFLEYLQEEEKLQQEYIKDKELIRVMVAQTITDEIPGPFNLEFHPRPLYSYPHIRNKATSFQLDTIIINYLDPLYKYFTKGLEIDARVNNKELNVVEQELLDGIRITHLRALHKWNTLSYIVYRRRNLIFNKKTDVNHFLEDAEKIRLKAMEIVEKREMKYRYDHDQLTTKHKDHTCYHFGYLYPVHQLHFWEREELQAKNGNYHFWYRSIWNVGRTVGLFD